MMPRVIQVLRYYADKQNHVVQYHPENGMWTGPSPVDEDRGQRAREILAELEKDSGK